MARKTRKPGRTLAVFFVALAIAYGLVALGGSWKPELGLDLQGGTRITLIADGSPSKENLDEARGIIDQRVNGSGVTEASVTTQGNNLIVVEIPGKSRQDLVNTVQRQAQLRFRMVACDSSAACGSDAASSGAAPGVTSPSAGATPSAPAAQRAPVGFGKADATPSATPSPSAAAPSASASAPTATASTPSGNQTSDDKKIVPVDSAVKFMNAPPAEWTQKFNDYTCPTTASDIADDPTQPLVTCDPDGTTKYLLSPAIIEGTDVTGAS